MAEISRRISDQIASRLGSSPVVMLEGPRSVGKSTLLTSLARDFGAEVINLDDPSTLAAVASDVKFFVSRPGPVFIDEYQKIPELLDWIKAELNLDSSAGRFILAGSTSFLGLPSGVQSLTGRLSRVSVAPFSQAELEGVMPAKVSELVDLDWLRTRDVGKNSRADYVARVMRGGFPLALKAQSESDRNRWANDYLNLILERDIDQFVDVRNKSSIKTVLDLLASRTGQILNLDAIATSAEITRVTAGNYVRLLESVFLTRVLESWGTTLGPRIGKRPKVHVLDSLIAARLLRATSSKLEQGNPTAMTQFGQLLESFTVREIIKHISFDEAPFQYGHFRDAEKSEVDLVVEDESGMVYGFEIKASTSFAPSDIHGLNSLRKKAGSRFRGGAVIHLGQHAHSIDGNIIAVPLDALFAPAL